MHSPLEAERSAHRLGRRLGHDDLRTVPLNRFVPVASAAKQRGIIHLAHVLPITREKVPSPLLDPGRGALHQRNGERRVQGIAATLRKAGPVFGRWRGGASALRPLDESAAVAAPPGHDCGAVGGRGIQRDGSVASKRPQVCDQRQPTRASTPSESYTQCLLERTGIRQRELRPYERSRSSRNWSLIGAPISCGDTERLRRHDRSGTVA